MKSLELVGGSVDFPITPKEHGIEFLMDNRTLWLRSKRQWAILRIRHTISKAIRDFFDSDGFTLLDAALKSRMVQKPPAPNASFNALSG